MKNAIFAIVIPAIPAGVVFGWIPVIDPIVAFWAPVDVIAIMAAIAGVWIYRTLTIFS